MDAHRYIEEIVVPTMRDYAANITSVRHGFLACLVTFHVVDYLATKERGARSLRNAFRNECPSFAVIDRVAHALKHVDTGNAHGPVQPLNMSEVVTRPPGSLGEFQIGVSRFGDGFGGVTLASDTNVDLLAELNSALAFLRAQAAHAEEHKARSIMTIPVTKED